MNKNMAVSHVLTVFLQISLVFLNIFYIISAKKCADLQCKVPISIAVALKDHESFGENYLSFKKGETLTIYSKYVGGDNSIWQGSLGGTQARFLRRDFVEEKAQIIKEDKLVDVASDTEQQDDIKAQVNEDQLPEESQHQADEEEEVSKDESVTDPGVSNESPVETLNTDDHTQDEHRHPTNEGANTTANEPDNEVANKAASESKDNGEHSQDKLTNDNEKTVQNSEAENNDPNIPSQVPDDNTYNQETMVDNDEGVDDRTERTRVYTNPDGIQYDVKIEYSDSQDEKNSDGVEVIGVAEQEQPPSGNDHMAGKHDPAEKDDPTQKDDPAERIGLAEKDDPTEKDDRADKNVLVEKDDSAEKDDPAGNDDQAGKVDDDKGNDQDRNAETPADGQEPTKLKKDGFFSSIGHMVSDFTENIIKDFQGEAEPSDKETKSNLDQETEDSVNSKKTEEEKSDEKQGIEIDSKEDGSNTKPSGFKGFQERFQQIKAARLERMKDDAARNEASGFPAVDKEEILKREAKRTVEGIPGLMKEEQNKVGEVILEKEAKRAVEEISGLMKEEENEGGEAANKDEKMISRENGDEAEKETPPAKQYSHDALCRSVPVEEREICMASGSREECLKDNCCFDETAEPAKQCFFKPSAPESAFAEKELISIEEEKSKEGNKTVVKTDKDSSEESESEKSGTAEQTDKTASGGTEELRDVELDDERKWETVDNSDDKSENGDVGTKVDADKSKGMDSVQEANTDIGSRASKSDDLDESSSKDSSSEERATAETVESTTSGKQAEEILSEVRDRNSDKQEEIDVKDPKEERIEEDKIGRSDTTSKDDAIVDTKESSDASVDSSKEYVESKDERQHESDSESEHSTSDSSSRIEKEKSLVGNVAESGEVDGQEKEASSAHDSEDDTSSLSSANENGGGGTEDRGASVDAGSKEKIQEEEGAIDKDSESAETEGEVNKEGESEQKVEDEVGGDIQNPSGSEAEMKSGANHSQNETSSREEESEIESNGVADRQGETSDSQGGPSEATLIDEVSEENEETLPEDSANKKKENQPDSEGILASIRRFLPGGGSTEKENKKTKEDTSDKVWDVNKIKVTEKVEKVNAEGDEEKDDTQKRDEDSESSEDVKEDQVDLKSEQTQEGNETNVKDADMKGGSEKDVEDDDKEMAEEIIADILEDESSKTEDATDSESISAETKVKEDRDNSLESGSTHFRNNTEGSSPVEKTLDKELEVNGSTLQGGEHMKTEIKETGVEETKAGLEATESGIEETRSGMESDVVPTKTCFAGSSETTTAGHRPFEKKFPNVASKWMKNKLMKGKRMAEKDAEEETSDMNGSLDSEKVDKDQHAGNMDENLGSGASTFEDPHSGTTLENDKDHTDDDIVEPISSDEEPEVKSVKTRFREILAVAVKNFREYHNLAAEYGLQMLKPVRNIVKSLGEQMGLKESIDYVEQELKHGPQGVIAVTLILIAFSTYFMLNILCGRKVPPAYGPNLKDIFRTYEGRIRILEEECSGYEEEINNLKYKADEHGENSSALEKQLDDEKHERDKSDKQISILKEIVQNYKEKVELLEEESSKLKQSLDQKSERINTMEEQLSEKSNEIEKTEGKVNQLEGQLKEKDEEKSELNEKIEEFKQLLSKAEDDTDRHKTMLQDWNDRYHELQQKYDDISVGNQTLEEQIHFKDNEIEVLRESLVQINNNVQINSDEELSQEEMQEARSKKIKELMDVSQIRTDYKLCKEEKEKLDDDIKHEVERREKLEGEVEQLEIDLAKSKASEEEIRFKYREADIKLNALQDYFKNMESELHRKLTAEEAARMASESELERKLREASTAVQDVELYRKQVEELRKEIDETQQSFRSQISSTEERAHENWLKFRSAERELEEIKRERDALRRRLYDLETKAPPADSVSISSTTADNLESPALRSESPTSSIRSSKRKNSNPRKSPSGSPLDERKERVRRKNRDRNSPPSWDSDMGPPPRRRDKDRETPPPPPPLWDPNMAPRRKGQRESPSMDAERRRRERYTPSPPPPPLDGSRRRRRDRPSSPPPPPPGHILPPRGAAFPLERSSSPPPPPPAHMFSPRGPQLPLERSPVQQIRGGPPRMNPPLTRPLQNAMASRPIGNGVLGGYALENTPPQRFLTRGGVPEQRMMPPLNTRFPGTSPTVNLRGPVPPFNTSLPQRGAPNEQSPMYFNSNVSNSTSGEDSEQPPPPPFFASNGPYPRPPRKSLPS